MVKHNKIMLMTTIRIKWLFNIYAITGIFPFNHDLNFSKLSLLVLLCFQLVFIFLISVIIIYKDDFIKEHMHNFQHAVIRIVTLISYALSDIFCSISMIFVRNEVNKMFKTINYYLFLNNLKDITLPYVKLMLTLTLYFTTMLYSSQLLPLHVQYHAAKFFYYYLRLIRIVLFKSVITSFIHYLNFNISMNTKNLARIRKIHLLSKVDLHCRCLCELLATTKSMLNSIFGMQLVFVMTTVFLVVLSGLYKNSLAIKAMVNRDISPMLWINSMKYNAASMGWTFLNIYLAWDIISSLGRSNKLVLFIQLNLYKFYIIVLIIYL